MANKRVTTESGLTGWRGRLQDQYEGGYEEFLSYDEQYRLAYRLGYDDPQECWDDNPLVEGSANPSDYCRVFVLPPGSYCDIMKYSREVS